MLSYWVSEDEKRYRAPTSNCSRPGPNGEIFNPMDDVQLVSENFHNDFIRVSDGKPRDLLLVLDSSGSIADEAFEKMKTGVKLLIDTLCGGFGSSPSQNRLSIVQFSTSTMATVVFSGDQNLDSLKAAVDRLRPMYGYTCTGDALGLAYLVFDQKYGESCHNIT